MDGKEWPKRNGRKGTNGRKEDKEGRKGGREEGRGGGARKKQRKEMDGRNGRQEVVKDVRPHNFRPSKNTSYHPLAIHKITFTWSESAVKCRQAKSRNADTSVKLRGFIDVSPALFSGE